MAAPRILTFNFHEPYLCLMAEMGWPLDIGLYESGPLARTWHEEYRPVPPKLRFVPEAAWRAEAAAGGYDVIIAQNETNAIDLLESPSPRLLLCHNRRNFLETTISAPEGDPREVYDRLLRRLSEAFEFIFISESKRASYGLPGRVILPGLRARDWGGYRGETRRVLRVGNVMRERELMFDTALQEAACAGLPSRVAGFNPGLPEARPTESFADLLSLYRTHRCLLHVTREEYEDGYNLAMLEAMACGMPVVTLANATSPITDGADGLVAGDAPGLRAHLSSLLDDLDRARAIGAAGRETVARAFPIERFVDAWQSAIASAAERSVRGGRRALGGHRARNWRRILLHYVASPITTGRYFEAAARARYAVRTAGFRAPEEVLALWGFPEAPPPYPPHDVDLPLEHTYAELRAGLPPDFQPDVYLWIDSGPKALPPDSEALPCPRIGYLIDTHIAPELRLDMARGLDAVFLAQRAQVASYRAAGLPHVYWMPLACSPELHPAARPAPRYDVAYVGSLGQEEGSARRALLDRVRARYPRHFIGTAWPHDMAAIYAASRVVVNACVNRDVNMRVFEALASGALLLTDPADGLEALFTDGEELVIYRDEADLFEKLDYYLAHEEERARIAGAGQAKALAEHTYARRLEDMLTMAEEIASGGGERLESPYEADAVTWDPSAYHESPRPELMPHIPLRARRVLDVGCGAGAFGHSLKRQAGVREVVGIEVVPEAAAKARRVLDQVIEGDLETLDPPFPDGHFDCIVCADVLEHLVEPAPVLRKLGRVLAPHGVIVISMPNIQFFEAVAMLSEGQWHYTDRGIMDRTHLRFYTRPGLAELVSDAGLEAAAIAPLSTAPAGDVPREPDGSLRIGKLRIANPPPGMVEDFQVFQYLVLACKPGVDRLAEARKALDAGDNEQAYALAVDAIGVNEAEQRRIIAKALARLGQLEKAEEHYREALRLRPDAIDIAGEYGILLVGMNRAGEARPLLERSLDEHKENDRVLGAMGLVLLTEQRHAEAFECFARALDANYDNVSLIQHFLDAARVLDRGAEAEPLLRRFVEFYPGNVGLACTHARLLRELGRVDEARDRLEMALLLAPRHAEAAALLREFGGGDAR